MKAHLKVSEANNIVIQWNNGLGCMDCMELDIIWIVWWGCGLEMVVCVVIHFILTLWMLWK